MLVENGGKFTVSTNWLNVLCRSLNLTMRARTTAAQKLPDGWEEQRFRMNQRVAVLVHKFSIPKVRCRGMGHQYLCRTARCEEKCAHVF